ncbi:hypothetical protein [Eikenella corrodens]|uniref:Uncharacterized protein n=1 Tax=Eikenella corrodens TaxID=539 RepID=A0A3S9SHA0_EIKCO|nr:hypothetical protein [Eikenella corrodens]AZR58915.1 hypothetical protein ELB75_02005 [Eikenella corrodens]
MIYTQDSNINITVENLENLYVLQDSDTKNNNFILFKDNLCWHQIYIDCSAIFIQPLDLDDLYSYMDDLSCFPLFEFKFKGSTRIEFHSKNSVLTIENPRIKINFLVMDDSFKKITLKLKEQA